VFIEKRLLYGQLGEVPEREYTIPIGTGDIKRPGRDVTIVGMLQGVHLALQAAGRLARQNIDAEVIDPRTLKPLDIDLICESVRKTHHLFVVSEAPRAGGYASEVVARVVEQSFDDLDHAPIRITALDTPIPHAASLERAVLPSVADIVREVKKVRS
jgi:pyruvate dehydrogenase E1 component beta subunit